MEFHLLEAIEGNYAEQVEGPWKGEIEVESSNPVGDAFPFNLGYVPVLSFVVINNTIVTVLLGRKSF